MTVKRDWLCHAAAALFSVCVVVPAALIFGDRSPPFEFGHMFFKPAIVHAGDVMRLTYTVIKITKECDGFVEQQMIDSVGKVYELGRTPTQYRNFETVPNRTFIRRKQVPLDFEPGPAVYRAVPHFWCNPLQKAYPIVMKPVEIKFVVSPGAPSTNEVD